MHNDVFLQFALFQTAAIAPICPHTAEHLWGLIRSTLEAKDGVTRCDSIMHLQWPSTEEPDESILAAADYLQDTLSRIRLAILKPGEKKKGDAARAKPTKAGIFVCTEAPEWQSVVVQTLQSMFDEAAWVESREAHGKDESKWWKFPSTTPKDVLAALPAAERRNKKVMPFLAMVRKEVESEGAEALNRTLRFDEKEVLRENEEFLQEQLATFGIEEITIADAGAGEDSLPGNPSFKLS